MYDSLSAANEARNIDHDAHTIDRYLVAKFTVHADDAEAERVRVNVEGFLTYDSDDTATDITVELRDPREVIDADEAQEWQDTLDADGGDVQPRFGYPIPAFLKSVAQLDPDGDEFDADNAFDTLRGIIGWARDFTGLTHNPGPGLALATDADERDRDALDAIATMLGTSPEWRSPASYLESIANLVGITERPHPGDYDPDEYAADFREATGRTVVAAFDYRD